MNISLLELLDEAESPIVVDLLQMLRIRALRDVRAFLAAQGFYDGTISVIISTMLAESAPLRGKRPL